MDLITHGLAGAIIARAGFSKSLEKWGPLTGVIAAASPDLDFILRLFGEEIFLRYHRGITHSLILLPVFSLFLALLFHRISSISSISSISRISKSCQFFYLYLLCFFSILSHILLDLMTSFGTMALVPLTDQRLAWDIVFIVDPYFTGILLIPVLLTYPIKRYKKELGVVSISILIPYIGLLISNHNHAISLAYRTAADEGLRPIHVAALPQPLSPFRWVLLIDTGDTLYQNFIKLNMKGDGWHNTKNMVWKKWPDSPWIKKALKLQGVEFYMWFARFPVAIFKDVANGHHLVEFIDLRFDILRNRIPFTYRVEFDREGVVVLEKFTSINSLLEDYGRR